MRGDERRAVAGIAELIGCVVWRKQCSRRLVAAYRGVRTLGSSLSVVEGCWAFWVDLSSGVWRARQICVSAAPSEEVFGVGDVDLTL